MFLWPSDRVSLLKFFIVILLSCSFNETLAAESDPSKELIAAGERLVHILDCNVCHTPKMFTPQGPQLDSSRLLSGHPADENLPPIPEGLISVTGWGGVFNNNLTSWAGPWGVSFGSNLTPDMESGIGGWTEGIFIESLRTGTHMEASRPFLPPMPTYDRLTDEELHAIFAYLQSIKPVRNVVPEAKLAPKPTQQK